MISEYGAIACYLDHQAEERELVRGLTLFE